MWDLLGKIFLGAIGGQVVRIVYEWWQSGRERKVKRRSLIRRFADDLERIEKKPAAYIETGYFFRDPLCIDVHRELIASGVLTYRHHAAAIEELSNFQVAISNYNGLVEATNQNSRFMSPDLRAKLYEEMVKRHGEVHAGAAMAIAALKPLMPKRWKGSTVRLQEPSAPSDPPTAAPLLVEHMPPATGAPVAGARQP